MSFYLSLFQIIETVERLDQDLQHLAGRALRISPRDARANRELLEESDQKITQVKNLLNNKTHISKISLRKAAILFQILEISYRRLMQLSAATSNVGHDDEGSIKGVWQLLSMAQKHYQILVKTIFDMTGIPVTLTVSHVGETPRDFATILQKEAAAQLETLKYLEKADEVFGEEEQLSEILLNMRKELLEAKRRFKHMGSAPVSEKPEMGKVFPEKSDPVFSASTKL
jgi:hypothetical protein